jgi:SAM-dependent methyltransferase
MSRAEFDGFAGSYDRDLERGLALTGETKDYFARRRLVAVRRALAGLGVVPRRVLDYGCGTGTAGPLLREVLGAETVVGVDPSEASLERARAEHPDPAISFLGLDRHVPDGSFDLGFVNGVFHHIPTASRAAAARDLCGSVRRGGVIALWENNPWNPGTRWVMRRVAFDRDAVMLSPREAARLLTQAGLAVVRVEHHFFFPRLLRWLRVGDPWLRSVPFGGQYLVLARRP